MVLYFVFISYSKDRIDESKIIIHSMIQFCVFCSFDIGN